MNPKLAKSSNWKHQNGDALPTFGVANFGFKSIALHGRPQGHSYKIIYFWLTEFIEIVIFYSFP